MKKKRMNKFVYTDLHGNESGFTFISMMLALVILIIAVPLIHSLLTNVRMENLAPDLKVQQLYLLLRNDFLMAEEVTVHSDTIYVQLTTGETATIEQYHDSIRRRVERKGHEIYLRDVKHFQLEQNRFGINVIVTTNEGVTYAKTIAIYE